MDLDEIKDLISECPVCLETINSVPIYQCRNGHVVCKDCHPKMETCPICRVHLSHDGPIRNLKLEDMVNRLQLSISEENKKLGQENPNFYGLKQVQQAQQQQLHPQHPQRLPMLFYDPNNGGRPPNAWVQPNGAPGVQIPVPPGANPAHFIVMSNGGNPGPGGPGGVVQQPMYSPNNPGDSMHALRMSPAIFPVNTLDSDPGYYGIQIERSNAGKKTRRCATRQNQ